MEKVFEFLHFLRRNVEHAVKRATKLLDREFNEPKKNTVLSVFLIRGTMIAHNKISYIRIVYRIE